MRVCRLWVNCLRSIHQLDIVPGDGINVLWGANGSGKTTVLEALHILNCGKSFRTGRVSDLITKGESQFRIRGEILGEASESSKVIKVQKGTGISAIDIDHTAITSASALAKAFPVLLVEPGSFAIVEGAPKVRRSLIDRAVFHVEQEFLERSRRYVYALNQRNRLLKNRAKSAQFEFWDDELRKHGEAIHRARVSCIESLNQIFAAGTCVDETLGRIRLRYRQGWPDGMSLAESIHRNLLDQMNTGSTSYGPHKAEMEITAATGALARIASRGQVKVVVICIVSALVNYIARSSGERPVVLVDDFAAELDNVMRVLALKMLKDTQTQIFLTSIDHPFANDRVAQEVTGFHVERGNVSFP